MAKSPKNAQDVAWSSNKSSKTKKSGLPVFWIVVAIFFAALVALYLSPDPEPIKVDKWAKYAPKGPIPTTVGIKVAALKFSGSKAPIMLKLKGSTGETSWMRVKPANSKFEFSKGDITTVSFGAADIGEIQGGVLRSMGTDGLDIKGRRSLNITYNHVLHEMKFVDLPSRSRIGHFTLKKTKQEKEGLFREVSFKTMSDEDISERAAIDAEEKRFFEAAEAEEFAGEDDDNWKDVEDEVEELLDDDDEDY